jgi:hypothetical protein
MSYPDNHEIFSFHCKNGISVRCIDSIAIDPDGGYWIGVYGGGVCYLP